MVRIGERVPSIPFKIRVLNGKKITCTCIVTGNSEKDGSTVIVAILSSKLRCLAAGKGAEG